MIRYIVKIKRLKVLVDVYDPKEKDIFGTDIKVVFDIKKDIHLLKGKY